jgi:hypothetical protein
MNILLVWSLGSGSRFRSLWSLALPEAARPVRRIGGSLSGWREIC